MSGGGQQVVATSGGQQQQRAAEEAAPEPDQATADSGEGYPAHGSNDLSGSADPPSPGSGGLPRRSPANHGPDPCDGQEQGREGSIQVRMASDLMAVVKMAYESQHSQVSEAIRIWRSLGGWRGGVSQALLKHPGLF